jgi:hypothetical protein
MSPMWMGPRMVAVPTAIGVSMPRRNQRDMIRGMKGIAIATTSSAASTQAQAASSGLLYDSNPVPTYSAMSGYKPQELANLVASEM